MGNLTPFSIERAPLEPPHVQAANAMRSFGIEPPQNLEFDGQIHRFATSQKPGDDAGYYVFYENRISGSVIVAGIFGCWRQDIKGKFRSNIGHELSLIESVQIDRRIDEARQRAESERKIRQEKSAESCQTIWDGLSAASEDHPYLKRKKIQPHIARISGNGKLVVPLYSIDGSISSLQYISDDGEKLYHAGAATKGKFCQLGSITEVPIPRIYMTEGYATGATVHEATGSPVFIAYSAGQLEAVAGVIKSFFPVSDLVIVADNDKSGEGQNHAEQAAAKHGARIIMPPMIDGQNTDANDYALSGGDLVSLLEPKIEENSDDGVDFIKQPKKAQWLIKGWIQADSSIMVYGPSGCGKTFLVLDWCMRMVTDIDDWCGKKVNHSPVFYLAGEGHYGLRARMAAWLQHHKKTLERGKIRISRSGYDLDTFEGLQKALKEIHLLPKSPSVVIVDTLHNALFGDENSSQDIKTLLANCRIIRETFNCSIILVHHTGHGNEDRARGSSSLNAAMEIAIGVTKIGETGMKVHQSKAKDSKPVEDVFMDLQTVDLEGWLDEDNEQMSSAVPVEGVEPVKTSGKSKVNEPLDSFEKSWFASGMETEGGFPYLTRSAWERYMVEGQNISPGTAKQNAKASSPNHYAGKLIRENKIEVYENGFRIIDLLISSRLNLLKGEKVN